MLKNRDRTTGDCSSRQFCGSLVSGGVMEWYNNTNHISEILILMIRKIMLHGS